MADNLEFATVLCQGGWDTTEDHLFIDSTKPGAASELVNYETGLYGGYRRISGYTYYNETYPTVDSANAEGKILGVFIFREADNTEYVIAARKQQGSTTYKFYYLSGGGWVAFAPGFTLNTTSSAGTIVKVRAEKFTFGGTNYIIFTDGINYATVYDGTNWYQIKSINTGGSGSPGGDQALDAPKYVCLFRNHVFISGDYAYPEVVAHCAPEDILTWTAAAGGGQLSASGQVQQIFPFRQALYVFNRDSIRNITAADTVFVINDTAKNIGCVAPDSVQEINGDVIFFSQDGVRNVSGTDKIGDINLASISKQIQQYVNLLQESYDLSTLNSVVIKKKSQFRYYVSSNADDPGEGLICGLRGGDQGVMYEFSRLYGINVSCVASGYIADEEVILHGGYDGAVYQQESGNSLNGSAITSVYATPYLAFGNPIVSKNLRQMLVFTRPESNFVMTARTEFNWENPATLNPDGYNASLLADYSLYDEGSLYDTGDVYGADSLSSIVYIDTEGSFFSMKLTLTTSGTDAPHSISGIIFKFSTEGKR